MTNYEFTDKELQMLAEAERKMDSGEVECVRDLSGNRLIVDAEVMAELGLLHGQSVSRTLVTKIMQRHLSKMKAKVALNRIMCKNDNLFTDLERLDGNNMKATIKPNKIKINSEELKRLNEIKIIADQLINVINSTNQVLNLEVSAKLSELIEKL